MSGVFYFQNRLLETAGTTGVVLIGVGALVTAMAIKDQTWFSDLLIGMFVSSVVAVGGISVNRVLRLWPWNTRWRLGGIAILVGLSFVIMEALNITSAGPSTVKIIAILIFGFLVGAALITVVGNRWLVWRASGQTRKE